MISNQNQNHFANDFKSKSFFKWIEIIKIIFIFQPNNCQSQCFIYCKFTTLSLIDTGSLLTSAVQQLQFITDLCKFVTKFNKPSDCIVHGIPPCGTRFYGLFVPRTIRTLDYSYYGWTIRTLDDSYDGLFVRWTILTMDFSYHGLFVLWTVRTICKIFSQH